MAPILDCSQASDARNLTLRAGDTAVRDFRKSIAIYCYKEGRGIHCTTVLPERMMTPMVWNVEPDRRAGGILTGRLFEHHPAIDGNGGTDHVITRR